MRESAVRASQQWVNKRNDVIIWVTEKNTTTEQNSNDDEMINGKKWN